MPSGFTAGVAEGKITTFKDFALKCVRGVGVCISMRDDPLDKPIPAKFEPDGYYTEALRTADKALVRYLALSRDMEAAKKEANIEYKMRLEAWTATKERRFKENERYNKMIAEVEAWQPPTAEHVGFKDFMLVQLKDSVKFDCGDYDTYKPKPTDVETWIKEKVENAKSDVAYHTKALEEEEARVAQRNKWLDELRKSL